MRGAVAAALLFALVLALPVQAAVPVGADLALMEVHINGRNTHETGVFWKVGDDLVAEPGEWSRLGIVLTDEEKGQPQLVSQTLGITIAIDDKTQTVAMKVPGNRQPMSNIRDDARTLPPSSPVAGGVLVNYSLAGSHSTGFTGMSLGHEVRTGGKWGVLSTSGQLNVDTARGAQYLRGNTFWQYDDSQHLISYQAGDVRVGGVSMGGISVSKDPRALDPLHPVFPLPTIGGLAMEAGELRVLANGRQVATHDIDAGPFTIENLPIPSGRSTTDLVVKDAYGREQVIATESLYFTPQLLRKGLTTWEVGAGKVRQRNEYGQLGTAASFEHGVSDRWTLTGGVQASKDGHNATLGSRFLAGNAGVVSVEASQSSSDTLGTGNRVAVGWDYAGPRFGVSVFHEQSKNYWDLSRLNPLLDPISEETRLALTYRSPQNSIVGRLGYTMMETQKRTVEFADLNLAYRNGPHTVQARGLYDMQKHEPTMELSYRYNFGSGNVYASVRQAPNITQARLTGQVVGDTKSGDYYQLTGDVLADDRGNKRATVRGSLSTDTGYAMASVSGGTSDPAVSASYSGAVHIGGDGVSWLRTVSDGYAVVRIPGVAGVPVKVNNRVVGKTDETGTLVVAPLVSLIGNKISIDDKALPMEVSLERSEAIAAPRRLSGALVEFPVKGLNARTVIVQRGEAVVAAGAAATAEGQPEAMVGYDGLLFLDAPKPGQVVQITDGLGQCTAGLPDPLPAYTEAPAVVQCR